MLVDDDGVTNYVHESIIEDADVAKDVIIAENGRQALEMVQQKAAQSNDCPGLIFLDINMPVMNGFEFLEAYQQMEKKFTQPIIIVMLTSSLNPKDIQRANQAGVTEFLDKPLTADKLQEVINKYF